MSAQLLAFFAIFYITNSVFLNFPESKKGIVIYAGLGAILVGWFGVEAYRIGSASELFEMIYNFSVPLIVAAFVLNFIIKILRFI